jgi:hypothetical protein
MHDQIMMRMTASEQHTSYLQLNSACTTGAAIYSARGNAQRTEKQQILAKRQSTDIRNRSHVLLLPWTDDLSGTHHWQDPLAFPGATHQDVSAALHSIL